MKSRPRLIGTSLLAIWSGGLVIGSVRVAGGCGKLFRTDAGDSWRTSRNGTMTIGGVIICRGAPPWAPFLEWQIRMNGAPTEGRPYRLGHYWSLAQRSANRSLSDNARAIKNGRPQPPPACLPPRQPSVFQDT